MSEENKNLTRIPQIFSFDVNALNRIYGEQAHLIRDILVFVSNKTTNDFFNDTTFTLDEFCRYFNYRKDELQKTLPQFIGNCKQDKLPVQDGHCFDSVFEYALYAGLSKVLVFSVKNESGDGFDLRNIVLFRRIKAVYKSSGRKEKRHYLVELDYKIKQMQLSRYFLTDGEIYSQIRIPKKAKMTGDLRNFFLYIGRMIAIVKYNIKKGEEAAYVTNVDELAKIMDLHISRNNNRKSKVKAYLDIVNEALADKGFLYSFFKGEKEKFEYSIKFIFPQNTLSYFDEQIKAAFFKKLYGGAKIAYFQNMMENGKNILEWMNSIDEETEVLITKWLFADGSSNDNAAKLYFLKTFEDIYGIKYDNRFGEFDLC